MLSWVAVLDDFMFLLSIVPARNDLLLLTDALMLARGIP